MEKGLILTVNYRGSKDTIAYVNSLLKLVEFQETDMVIVDNASGEDTVNAIINFLKEIGRGHINFLKLEKNLGYFGAVRYALDNHVRDLNKYAFIIISNNDIIIKDTDFFQKIKNNIKKCDVIAPRIISLVSGKEQNPHREKKITSLQKFQYRLLFTNYYIGKLLYLFRRTVKKIISPENKNINLTERNIFSLHGSFLIFSPSFFKKGGYIDNGFFLYGEEDSITAICQKLDCIIRFIPEIVVHHNEHQTTMAAGFKKNIYEMQKEAYRYIKNKYKSFY